MLLFTASLTVLNPPSHHNTPLPPQQTQTSSKALGLSSRASMTGRFPLAQQSIKTPAGGFLQTEGRGTGGEKGGRGDGEGGG